MSEINHNSDAEGLLQRRTILKFMAAAPLVATFGLLPSPLMRFLKPSMTAGNFFQNADLPEIGAAVQFQRNDFPEVWTCIPVLVPVSYAVFNPQGHEIRKIPAFMVRTEKHGVVAFSRICTYCRHTQPINFVMDTAELGLARLCKTPVLCCPCPCDASVFDLNDNGRVLRGPAWRPLRKMTVAFDGENYTITGIEPAGIA
jgi:Rieske Fe-S protein